MRVRESRREHRKSIDECSNRSANEEVDAEQNIDPMHQGQKTLQDLVDRRTTGRSRNANATQKENRPAAGEGRGAMRCADGGIGGPTPAYRSASRPGAPPRRTLQPSEDQPHHRAAPPVCAPHRPPTATEGPLNAIGSKTKRTTRGHDDQSSAEEAADASSSIHSIVACCNTYAKAFSRSSACPTAP